MPVTRVQAQFKLSQDKTAEDRARVIEALEPGPRKNGPWRPGCAVSVTNTKLPQRGSGTLSSKVAPATNRTMMERIASRGLPDSTLTQPTMIGPMTAANLPSIL